MAQGDCERRFVELIEEAERLSAVVCEEDAEALAGAIDAARPLLPILRQVERLRSLVVDGDCKASHKGKKLRVTLEANPASGWGLLVEGGPPYVAYQFGVNRGAIRPTAPYHRVRPVLIVLESDFQALKRAAAGG